MYAQWAWTTFKKSKEGITEKASHLRQNNPVHKIIWFSYLLNIRHITWCRESSRGRLTMYGEVSNVSKVRKTLIYCFKKVFCQIESTSPRQKRVSRFDTSTNSSRSLMIFLKFASWNPHSRVLRRATLITAIGEQKWVSRPSDCKLSPCVRKAPAWDHSETDQISRKCSILKQACLDYQVHYQVSTPLRAGLAVRNPRFQFRDSQRSFWRIR